LEKKKKNNRNEQNKKTKPTKPEKTHPRTHKPKPWKTYGLVLAGIELIFFIVAGMGLCFGFVLKTVLITQGCFSYC